MIFITPIFWTKTLHASRLRRFLSENGHIEYFIDFNEMPIFDGVSSTILVFKYIKGKRLREDAEPTVKCIKVHTKKRLDESYLAKIQELIVKIRNNDEYFVDGIFECFRHDQFKGGQSWNAIPRPFIPEIEHLEEFCMNCAPLVDISVSKKNIRLHISELYTKDDLEENGIQIKMCKKVNFNGTPYYIIDGVEDIKRPVRLGDITDIGNGLVSGLDSAFKMVQYEKLSDIEKGKMIKVVKAYNLTQYYSTGYDPYIFVNDIEREEELKANYPFIYNYLKENKDKLESRYQYNKVTPWWHWVFLRNWKLFTENKKKIFCPCKERIDKKQYARFSLIEGGFVPTQDVTAMVLKPWVKEDIRYIMALLNSDIILHWMKYKGLSRGGVLEFSERPLSKIPMRLIDWENKKEVSLYNEIIGLVNKIIQEKNSIKYKGLIEERIKALIGLN
ncbi:MAG: hypothetical protein DDT42_01709 [candidate division WS2 bacterium]|uniref:site-specific DNA-methyltransferase (adenine-specific) n=1 Tax=Psychracetigena formicireducens TaxID=2986056 RepID=A0A9E2BHW6_PSYF1|nr:hypothetical protein [Candidatus Psychracetigena formicireducens]